MGALTDAYADLLIKQYWDKTNAQAEIGVIGSGWETAKDLIDSWRVEFDIDEAYGHRLDLIGAIVGMPRTIPYVIPKLFFGFDVNSSAGGFDSKFAPVPGLPPFRSKFEAEYETLELVDADYRTLIKSKIAKNVAKPPIASDGTNSSIQDAVNLTFGGSAVVVDNFDMTLTLYISPGFSEDILTVIVNMDLLPKPQGVRYNYVIQAYFGETFGFSVNPLALGFGSKFDSRVGGKFARKVIF